MKKLKYYTPAGLAKIAGKATSTVYSHLRSGLIPHDQTLDGARLIRMKDAHAYRDADLRPGVSGQTIASRDCDSSERPGS